MKKKKQLKTWKVEYEIPPLRAIYTSEADCPTEAHVRKLIELEEPTWKIRKITLQSKRSNRLLMRQERTP